MDTFGWQYLYTDLPFTEVRPETVDYLKRMLETLPVVFPERDYSVLRERLEQRL
jgi:hypothetical protein